MNLLELRKVAEIRHLSWQVWACRHLVAFGPSISLSKVLKN